MRKRGLIILVGMAMAIWPFASIAQKPAIAVIGVINGQLTAPSTKFIDAFRKGLAETGFIEGKNLAIVYRSAEGNVDRLPVLVEELVDLRVSVLAAVGGDVAVAAAKSATTTIPIVFTTGGDPVATGFVTSINKPTGNLTGVTFMGSLLAPKQIGLLRDMVPGLMKIGLLLNPANAMTPEVAREVKEAAEKIGLEVVAEQASVPGDVEDAFTHFAAQRVGALIIGSAVFFNRNRQRLIALSNQHRIPSIFNTRDFPEGGGLMSYGADTADSYRVAGTYAGRILAGAKPQELPIQAPTKFELVINLKTAKALGLSVSPGLIAIADEVLD